MRGGLRLLGLWMGAMTVAGCCGPCARWIMSNATSSSAPPALPGTSGSSEPDPGAPGNNGAAPANNSGSSGGRWNGTSRHPIFPGRRGYYQSRDYLATAGGRLPQLQDPQTVFDAMPAEGGKPPTDGLVVCRIQLKVRLDDFRGADTGGDLTVGARNYDFYGPEDQDLVYFSVPHAPWKTGEKLTLQVWDRDVTTHEDAGTVTGTIGSFPLRMPAPKMEVECRSWPSETVEERARLQAIRAQNAVSRARGAKPLPGEAEWGYAKSGIGSAWKEIDELAAFVGWEDPRVRSAGQDLEKIEADWTVAATKSVAEVSAKLPPFSQKTKLHLGDVDATLESITCDAKRAQELLSSSTASPMLLSNMTPCILEIRATRTLAQSSLFIMPERAARATLVMADGSEVSLTQVQMVDATGKVPDDFQWAPKQGESYTVRFLPSDNVPIGAHPGSPGNKGLGQVKLLRFDARQTMGSPALVRVDG